MTPTTAMLIFYQMAAAAILFLMDTSQKVIRSSEIPREKKHTKFECNPTNVCIRYHAHKLLRRPSGKMAAYGLVSQKIYWMNCPGTSPSVHQYKK